MYCAHHHPPTAEAKRKAREERYIAEAKARNLIRDRQSEIESAREAVVEAARQWLKFTGEKRESIQLVEAVRKLEAAERGQ
jgi:hypothetical protein